MYLYFGIYIFDISFVFLSLIAIFFIVSLYFPVSNIYKLMKLDYSLESSIAIYKMDLHDELLVKQYSKIVDEYID